MSCTISPRTLMIGTTIDFLKHFKIEFGSYAEAHKKNSSKLNEITNRTRYLPWIYRKHPRSLLVPQLTHWKPHQTTKMYPSSSPNARYWPRARAHRRRRPEPRSWMFLTAWEILSRMATHPTTTTQTTPEVSQEWRTTRTKTKKTKSQEWTTKKKFQEWQH